MSVPEEKSTFIPESQRPIGVEKLRRWLDSKELTQAWLAKILGTSRGRVNHYFSYRTTMPALEAAACEELTNGQVKAAELMLSPEALTDPLGVCRRRKVQATALSA